VTCQECLTLDSIYTHARIDIIEYAGSSERHVMDTSTCVSRMYARETDECMRERQKNVCARDRDRDKSRRKDVPLRVMKTTQS